MLLNYLKLSIRLLIRNPFFTCINVIGLAIGFAVFFILWPYTQSGLNSDQQWKDSNRIARLGFEWTWSDDGNTWQQRIFGSNGPHIVNQLTSDYPELESFTRIMHQNWFTVDNVGLSQEIIVSLERSDQSKVVYKEDKVVCADANVFEFFPIPLISGSQTSALRNPNSVAICERLEKKYFGLEDALGKTVIINGKQFVVTGIFANFSHNTHLDFEMALSNSAFIDYWSAVMPVPNAICYVKSRLRLNWQSFEDKINQPFALEKHWGEVLKSFPRATVKNRIQPLREMPFEEWTWSGFVAKSRPLLITFQVIGFFVLALAIINYIILNTSRTALRMKEVATRKVTGALERDFFKQFFIETIVLFILAIGLSLTLAQVAKSPLQSLLQIPVGDSTKEVNAMLIAVIITCIVICSTYPVYMARSYQPRALLAGAIRYSTKNNKFLSLALIQYSLAIALMVSSFLVYRQITFLLNKDLGFKKDLVVVVDAPVIRPENFENAIHEFAHSSKRYSDIAMTTISSSVMGDEPNLMTLRRNSNDLMILDSNGGVDEHFIPFYNLNILAGRNFHPDEKSNAVIISTGALPRLGFSDAAAAVGQWIEVLDQDLTGNDSQWNRAEIIGVIEGYRLRPSLRYGNELDKGDRGIALTYRSTLVPYPPQRIGMRINTTDLEDLIANIKADFDELFPGNVFHWYFLDDHFNRHYRHEKTWRNQILFFTSLSIGIACLGLLGMISNMVLSKTKEIGIRKVLGAPTIQIVGVLLNTTLKQVAVSAILGLPLAYYFAQRYLERFSEQITLHWWHFALPVLILVIIMFSTIASVLWKAARTNPVDALKCE